MRIRIRQTAAAAMLLTIIWTGGAAGLQKNAPDPGALFRAAGMKEVVDGDLKGAIELYKKVVDGKDRALAAQALLRMAEAYQKLGDAEARRIYERIVQQYADQKDAAAMAKARLGVGEGAAMTVRQLLTLPSSADVYGAVSPDGRFITYPNWSTGVLVIQDLKTGRKRALTPGYDEGQVLNSTISHDGRQVGYSWYNNDHRRYELRVASLEGSGLPQSRLLYSNEDVVSVWPFDWSPDGRWIAVRLNRRDRTNQLGLVSVRDGSLRTLKSAEWLDNRPNELFFSPDGKYLGFDRPVSTGELSQHDVFILAVDGSREVTVAAAASEDTMMGWSPDGSHLLFASDRGGTVGLWAIAVADGKPQGTPVMVKPDSSRQSYGVSPSGKLYTGVLAGDLNVHIATVDFQTGKPVSAPVTPVQSFAGFNTEPVWSPNGKFLAYLSAREQAGGNRVLGILSAETGEVRELRPKLSYFNYHSWSPDSRFLLVGQASDLNGRQGGMYQIDVLTGDATLIRPGGGRAPMWSPDGKKIYLTKPSPNEGRPVFEWDVASGTERKIVDLKMAYPRLSPDGRYLAAADNDESTESSALLVIPVSGGAPREVLRVRPPNSLHFRYVAWMPDGRAVVVFGKINESEGLWLVPIDGGAPRKLDIGRVKGTAGFSVHGDGKRVAYVAGAQEQQVWVLENFSTLTRTK